jgi:hypothetical protein
MTKQIIILKLHTVQIIKPKLILQPQITTKLKPILKLHIVKITNPLLNPPLHISLINKDNLTMDKITIDKIIKPKAPMAKIITPIVMMLNLMAQLKIMIPNLIAQIKIMMLNLMVHHKIMTINNFLKLKDKVKATVN